MKYLTVYATSSRSLSVKSQQGLHRLWTSEQALGGRGKGMVGSKEGGLESLCAHLKLITDDRIHAMPQ